VIGFPLGAGRECIESVEDCGEITNRRWRLSRVESIQDAEPRTGLRNMLVRSSVL
jgi:hypothetical protein